MDSSSGMHWEVCRDLAASSAVNFPISIASFRLVVIWMGVGSTRCTYCGARVPLRFTFTINLMFFINDVLSSREFLGDVKSDGSFLGSRIRYRRKGLATLHATYL